ncbi:MAG: argininosuccinate lyase [Verrucomicrobia bacterium]|nr:argininosuccinate lyase [Verrucomicrobiota bacterium]MDE3046851.1 argininosuccinate lyase [Verrucomicrobiota bacterium]
MSKLWSKGYDLQPFIERFMTGDDPKLDLRLVIYDCRGSIAHAAMLCKIGILTEDEYEQLKKALEEIISLSENGTFTIANDEEDVHTAVENFLTRKLGETGKKIHTARSRNDQILTDVRLYMRDQIILATKQVETLCKTLRDFAKKHTEIPYVGRTHYQKAMPSSWGLWAGAFLESLLDDAELLKGAYQILDQCPLGSAASYGVSLLIDRQLTADALGFAAVQNNVLYANNSRGKFEGILIHALSQIMLDLSKMATDMILFSAPEMGYLKLPVAFCPGSSLMPQKKNPCPLELIRAKSAAVTADLFQILETVRALPSGYNRDFQETKRPLFHACDTTVDSLEVMHLILEGIAVDEEACLRGFTNEVFATDEVLNRIQQNGVPFREAYRQVAEQLDSLEKSDPKKNILAKIHIGATGNLGLECSEERIKNLNQLRNLSEKR